MSISSSPLPNASQPLPAVDQTIAGSFPNSLFDNSQRSPQTLVFVDSEVEHLDTLIAGIENARVVVIDSQANGIDQITSVLAGYHQLASVQIISHGKSGAVQLGNAQLSSTTLNQYRDRLQSWGNALSETGDLLFYGCNVAAGTQGLKFIDQISQITQADVQASDDLTGSATLGGDWDLEVATGAIEATLAVNAETQASYDSDLATRSFNYNASQYQLTNGAKTWKQAQAEAKRLGGNLVIINNAAEENQLKQNFGNKRKLWIGLTDRRQEGKFLWSNGQAPNYLNWSRGQPNQNGANKEDYVVMNAGKKHRWDDKPLQSKFRGIIEIPGVLPIEVKKELPVVEQPKGSLPSRQTQPQTVGASAIALEKSSYLVNEAAGFIEIALVRTGDTSRTATAVYKAESRTATDGQDFTGGAYPITFNPGETRKTSRIPILQDTDTEGSETFAVLMQNSSVDEGTIRTANITILDDESDILDVKVLSTSEKTGQIQVTLTRSNTLTAASVDFATANGLDENGAIAGNDYTSTTGTLNFAVGEAVKTITIPLVNDGVPENNETFSLNFTNPLGLTLTNPTQQLTIIDDDAAGFVKETLITGFNQPTAFARTPTNELMFISEKGGMIKTAQGNQVVATFADLSRDVNNIEDRGVLSIAVHPEFYTGKPYVYVSYTYDPPEAHLNVNPNSEFDDPDRVGNRPARVVRLTADVANNYRTVVAGSQEIILGKNSTWANTSSPDGNSTDNFSIPESGRSATGRGGYVQDYVKTDSQTHTIGNLKFGADGALYISTGDGASFILDERAASTLNIDSLSGKMLRVDPLTGAGLTENPFYDAANPNDNRSKVWQYGLRNPYRFTFKPGTSTPVIGDVGWGAWEEVNIGGKGANFGWPGYEGPWIQPGYFGFQSVKDLLNNTTVTPPIYARSHQTDNAKAITMGDFYKGELFIADVNTGDVDALTLNASDQVTAVRRFASDAGFIVFMQAGPEDSLYYVDITGSIGRWKPIV